AALAGWEVAEPRRVHARMRHVRAARYLRIGTESLARLARDRDVEIGHPLLEAAVWDAVSGVAPRSGYLGRDDGMAALFSDLLPPELLARADKASFDELFFNDHSRTFAREWAGHGDALVDGIALRDHWRAGTPRAQSFTLLQAAWLVSGDRGEQSLGRRVERVPAPRPAQPQHRK
ncbi:MAG TPA: hypothetical protein VFM58_01040, partial [Solirubrobacteraceae bacterium]|nr:hypothetical protein [Solirubrobacteraceae bacterium]